MAIICTVLHICNTPRPLFLYITLLEYRIVHLWCFALDIKKKTIKEKTNCNCSESEDRRLYHKMKRQKKPMYVITRMVQNLLLELFIVPCLLRSWFPSFMVLLYFIWTSFFLNNVKHCTPPHPSSVKLLPLASWVLAPPLLGCRAGREPFVGFPWWRTDMGTGQDRLVGRHRCRLVDP